jgi:hypothetical protein
MYNGFFLLQSAAFVACPLALEGYLPLPATSCGVVVLRHRGDSPLFFGLLLLLELDLELFDSVLTLGFLHAHLPFCLVSCGGL